MFTSIKHFYAKKSALDNKTNHLIIEISLADDTHELLIDNII